MSVINFKYKSSYYKKILLQLFVVAVIPLLIVTAVLGSQLLLSFSERASQVEELALSQSVLQTEEMLRSIRRSALQFSSQSDTIRAMRLDNPQEDIVLFNKLRNACLILMQNYNSDMQICGVKVTSSKEDWIYDTETGYREMTDEDLAAGGETGAGTARNETVWKVELDYAKDAYYQLSPSNYVLSCNVKFLNFGEVSIRMDYEDFCANFDLYKPFYQLYVLDNAGRIIYDSATGNIGANAGDTAFYSSISGDSGSFSYTLNGEKFRGIFKKSEELDWYYVSIRKETFPHGNFVGGFLIAAIVSFVVIVIAFFVVSLLSRKLYRPIYNLRHRLAHTAYDSRINEQINEVQAIELTIDDMIDDNRRLKKQVVDQRVLMREFMICQLFTGNLQQEQYDLLESYAIHMPWQVKVLVGICSPQIRQNEEDMSSEMYSLGILQTIAGVMPDNSLAAPVMIDNMVLFIAGTNETDYEKYIEDNLKEIYEQVNKNLHIDVGIAVSASFSDMNRIAENFDRIKRFLRYQSDSNKGIFFLEKNSSQIRYPTKASEEVLDNIKSGDIKASLSALDVFFDDIFLRVKDDYQQQLCAMWLIGDILRLVPDYSALIINHSTTAGNSDPVQTLFSIPALEDKKEWMLENVIKPVDEMLHANDANKLFIVKQMLGFIKEAADPLSSDIESCAKFLNYNSTYLRKVFKDAMGISYSKYVSKMVMEKARDMLLDTTMPVGTVAKEFGYSNSQNFIRHFKNEFGMTPGQFRNTKS